MSTAPAQTDGTSLPPLPLPGATPREIRAALHPEYREDFDRDYQEALDEAGRSLDLAGIHDMVEHWRLRTWITRDKQEHRRVFHEAVAVTEARL